jgi:adenosylhomocysteine nucleosidase
MKILVAYAVDPEFAPWKKLRKFQEISAGHLTIYRTDIGSATVDFIATGMGPAHARRAIHVVAATQYALCIAAGFAGSLRPELGVCDIVIPQIIRDAGGSKSVGCDAAAAIKKASTSGKSIDAIVSSEKVASTVEEKRALASLGDAVDMESFTVVAAAREHKIPAAVVRAVSDAHDQAMPVDFSAAIDERGQVSMGSVLKLAAGSPSKIAALMRLGRDSKQAAETLARFLEATIERLAATEDTSADGTSQFAQPSA